MAEDDTFDALRKIPNDELLTVIRNIPLNEWLDMMASSGRDVELTKLLKQHGWTLDEYMQAFFR